MFHTTVGKYGWKGVGTGGKVWDEANQYHKGRHCKKHLGIGKWGKSTWELGIGAKAPWNWEMQKAPRNWETRTGNWELGKKHLGIGNWSNGPQTSSLDIFKTLFSCSSIASKVFLKTQFHVGSVIRPLVHHTYHHICICRRICHHICCHNICCHPICHQAHGSWCIILVISCTIANIQS